MVVQEVLYCDKVDLFGGVVFQFLHEAHLHGTLYLV